MQRLFCYGIQGARQVPGLNGVALIPSAQHAVADNPASRHDYEILIQSSMPTQPAGLCFRQGMRIKKATISIRVKGHEEVAKSVFMAGAKSSRKISSDESIPLAMIVAAAGFSYFRHLLGGKPGPAWEVQAAGGEVD